MRICKRSHKRRVHINGEEWNYRVVGINVDITGPQQQRHKIEYIQLYPHWTYDELERCSWKGNGIDPITPSKVKEYIIQHFVGAA